MRKISHHVREVLSERPFLSEVLREGIGNVTAIAKRIRKEVERRAYGRVSVPSIAVALHRAELPRNGIMWGHKYLRNLSDITVRANLLLWYVAHTGDDDRHLYERLARISQRRQGVFCNVIYGVRETMLIAHRDLEKELERALADIRIVGRKHSLSAITMRFPEESLEVPGVYYPILQRIAWEGVSTEEVISVRTEFTVVCKDADIEKVLRAVTALARGE